jgi:hypothetical protein
MNVSCHPCFDANESRPGVTSTVLFPMQAVHYLKVLSDKIPNKGSNEHDSESDAGDATKRRLILPFAMANRLPVWHFSRMKKFV